MNRFKIIAFVFIFMLIASCSKEERGGGPHIILNKDALTLSVGSEERLEIVVRSGGQVENPVWARTSPDVASVDMAGRGKGLKAGQATRLVAAGKLSAV